MGVAQVRGMKWLAIQVFYTAYETRYMQNEFERELKR